MNTRKDQGVITHPSNSGPHPEQIMESADIHLTDNHVVVCFDKAEQIYLSSTFARELGQRLISAALDLDHPLGIPATNTNPTSDPSRDTEPPSHHTPAA